MIEIKISSTADGGTVASGPRIAGASGSRDLMDEKKYFGVCVALCVYKAQKDRI
jgi:hypothetical protein